jgi:hypothetical protein
VIRCKKRVVCVSLQDLESDYPWSGLKDENSPTPELSKF